MKKIIHFMMTNSLIYTCLSLVIYIFYGIVIGSCMIPSFLGIQWLLSQISLEELTGIIFLAFGIGIAIYLYFITSLLVFGIIERILTIGFKPGKYKTNSFLFARWMIYSGLHIILLNTTLPFMTGTPWGKLFYRILGCKLGKNVFINSKGLHEFVRDRR